MGGVASLRWHSEDQAFLGFFVLSIGEIRLLILFMIFACCAIFLSLKKVESAVHQLGAIRASAYAAHMNQDKST